MLESIVPPQLMMPRYDLVFRLPPHLFVNPLPHHVGVMEDGFKSANFESLAIFRPAAITHNSNTPGWLNWISPGLDKMLPNK